MSKYSPEIVEKICQLLATGQHKLVDVCKQVGIHHDTFYEWKKQFPEFAEAVKEAERERLDAFRDMASTGLAVLLQKHEYEETVVEYVPDPRNPLKPKVKSQRTSKKVILPNPTAVIFTLTNREAENWRHKENIDHNIIHEDPMSAYDFSKLSDEELEMFEYLLEKMRP